MPDQLAGDVLIRDGAIESVGPTGSVTDGAQVVDTTGFIVLPGLVDAHQHLWEAPYLLQHPDLGLSSYFTDFVPGAAASVTPDGLFESTVLALTTAVRSGTTTTFDWCHVTNSLAHAEAAVAAAHQVGTRYVFGYGPPVALGYNGADRHHPHEMETFLQRHDNRIGDLVRLAAALRGPDLSSTELTRADIARARAAGVPISMHVATHRSGPGGVTTLHRAGLLGPDIQLVHLTDATSEELTMLADTDTRVVVPPIAELSMGTGLPPFRQLADRQLGYGLGVDSVLGSPPDMFAQMRSAANLLRAAEWIGTQPPGGSLTKEVLLAATIGGARASWLDQITGSLTPGKAADLLVFRPTRPVRTLPEAYGQVVWMGDDRRLESVLVSGQQMLR
jgi:cytosine/adenosine deaminase-related metal-dependent hydrolase